MALCIFIIRLIKFDEVSLFLFLILLSYFEALFFDSNQNYLCKLYQIRRKE
jgi:hypothetical protein